MSRAVTASAAVRQAVRPVAAVGESVPAVCHIEDVLRHLNLSRRTFERQLAARELPLVELARLGRRRRFTGASVLAAKSCTRWVAGGRGSHPDRVTT